MTRIAFIDRDGTLIEEPADEQIDSYEKFRLVAGCIPALIALRDAGFEFVMVSNQDGLGTASFPRETFTGPQELLLQILESQGIRFREILIDESFPADDAPTRKPRTGLVQHYLRDRAIDLDRSVVIGDRQTDIDFAANLGVRGFRLGADGCTWDSIAHVLTRAPRAATVQRDTRETRIRVAVDLDHAAAPKAATGIAFFDHMLEQLGKHGGFALEVQCEGDLEVDEHHTVEDCALAIGQALREALGDKRGIARYGSEGRFAPRHGGLDADAPVALAVPMDETLASVALDLSGRPYFVFRGGFPREQVGGLPTELVPHFFRSLAEAGGISLHLAVAGENAHHMVEACFKATARALRQAIARAGSELPSTKGVL